MQWNGADRADVYRDQLYVNGSGFDVPVSVVTVTQTTEGGPGIAGTVTVHVVWSGQLVVAA